MRLPNFSVILSEGACPEPKDPVRLCYYLRDSSTPLRSAQNDRLF